MSFIFMTTLVVLLLSSITSAQTTVEFFYSPLRDSCEWGAINTFAATNNTANGGLCAYISSTNRLYACPAPDAACWAFNQNCKNGINTPSSDQILCGSSNGDQWCCSTSETCTENSGQINVCISSFENPFKGVTPADAQKKEYSALPSTAIGTATPKATPTPFLTRIISSSSSGSSKSSTSLRSSSSSSKSATATSSTSSAGRASHSGLSGGAIAGIVIGAVAAVAIVAGIVIFIVQKRRAVARSEPAPAPAPDVIYAHVGDAKAELGPQSPDHLGDGHNAPPEEPPHELPENTARQELP